MQRYHQRLTPWLICTLLALVLAACSGNDPGSSAALARDGAGAKGALLFFLNPNGGPCRMQEGILEAAREQIKTHADIRYVSTTRDADRQLFYQFGIRALPAIVLVDPRDREVGRLPPGVQSAERILAAVARM